MNDRWINSKEILLKTNISRATLNNYIKIGILPKPHIRKIEGGQKGPRQIGYFPVSVLDRLTTVNRLKSEGRSMEEIALKFKEIPSKETSLHKSETSPEMEPWEKTDAPDDPVTYNVQKGSDDPVLRLTIEDLHSPAYLIKRQLPSLVSLCVLVADLQDSVKISSELMPGEYFQLINDLWKTLAGTFEKYNAICGKHAGDGMLHYFIKKPDSNYLMDAIHCALELREKTKVFSKEMKLKKGWFNDLFLNVGINEGQEFFGTIRSASNIEFTALGDSINYAGRLSDFARFGKIWTTKNVIIKLTEEELSSLCFGVSRKEADHERFVENSFLRVIDLLDSTRKEGNKFADIATLPITEIVGKKDIAKPLAPLSEQIE